MPFTSYEQHNLCLFPLYCENSTRPIQLRKRSSTRCITTLSGNSTNCTRFCSTSSPKEEKADRTRPSSSNWNDFSACLKQICNKEICRKLKQVDSAMSLQGKSTGCMVETLFLSCVPSRPGCPRFRPVLSDPGARAPLDIALTVTL